MKKIKLVTYNIIASDWCYDPRPMMYNHIYHVEIREYRSLFRYTKYVKKYDDNTIEFMMKIFEGSKNSAILNIRRPCGDDICRIRLRYDKPIIRQPSRMHIAFMLTGMS